ncbi:unnamed protein product [Phaedon cochleariae]|uniref:BPTI/Kunitz inhibitor domain-containing protein n=1 Tax=Phaedon cochleariae TaxID=80249 RepID=A0A9P0GHW2_PHACE|nr:unnamed protein product [Phaedon cochleariae]
MMVKMNIFTVVAFVLLLVQMISGLPSSKESAEAICQLPEVRGFCRALMPRWRYNSSTKQCYQFNYGGCGGNENNFRTEKACKDKCSGV